MKKVEVLGDSNMGRVRAVGDPDFEAFKAGCKGISLDQVRRDWRRERTKIVLSRKIWNEPPENRGFLYRMLGNS